MSRFDSELYPDVARALDLRSALQAQFDAGGMPERADHHPAPGWRHVAASVSGGERQADVVMAMLERAFLMQFWMGRGLFMASGNTDDLAAVAGAVHLWVSGARVRELRSAWPFVSFGGLAEAHERGETAEYQWRSYHDNVRGAPHLLRLHAFFAVAIREHRLRELVPFTSHWTLGFSRTPGYPHSGGCPSVVPLDDGRYRVVAADGRELGVAGPEGSVALVLAALDDPPPGR